MHTYIGLHYFPIDIWSIINQDDAARTQSRRHSERAQRNAPENFKSAIKSLHSSHSPNLQLSGNVVVLTSFSSLIAIAIDSTPCWQLYPFFLSFSRQGSPFIVYSQPFHRSKRSPDHVPGHTGSDHSHDDHDDHDHSHHSPSNSGNFLVGHLSLISIAILLSKLL